MAHAAVNSISLTLILTAGLFCQTPAPPATLSDTDQGIDGFRQVSRELNDSVKIFYTHLGQAIARHDRGYRTEDGRPVQGADADLIGGPPDVTWAAIQKFVSFRMLAVRNDRKSANEPVVADLERVQKLILDARKQVDASTAILRRLLVVSVADLDPHNDAATKERHDRLLKARVAAEEAAKRAMLALPLDLQNDAQPDESAPDEIAQRAWDLLGRRGLPEPRLPDQRSPEQDKSIPNAGVQAAPAIPISFVRRKRITLINELSYRMAVTDSGIVDGEGRHIFYQEEWVQRGQSVIRFRWRVAVETASGEHVLLKRYPPRELHGTLEDLYGHRDRDYVWYLEPPDDSTEPARDEIEYALAGVSRSSEAIRAVIRDFKTRIGESLAQQDRVRAGVNEPAMDSGLPEGMRQRLFAIRAHLARVPSVLESESAVRRAVSQAEAAVRGLEPLAAWSNRISGTDWAQLLDRSDWEIDSARNAETDALRSLPPDSTRAEDQFPALDKNTIIRIRRPRSKNPADGSDTAVRCLQEVWRMEGGLIGTREVKRTVSLILVAPRTGNQNLVGGATRYYKASPGDALEGIFDEYASDDVDLGS